MNRWCIWFVTYGTCWEDDIPARIVSQPMSFDQARAAVDKLGFGYCMKPEKF
jgi:hypothetical protein